MNSEQRARELLSDELGVDLAYFGNDPVPLEITLRAIVRALEQPKPAEAKAEVYLDFDQVGTAGPFPVSDGKVFVPAVTISDLVSKAGAKAEGAVAWMVRWQHGPKFRADKLFDELEEAQSFYKWRDTECSRPVELLPLYAEPPRAVGGGFVVVPRVLTLEMEIAFCEAWYSKRRCIDDSEMQDAYTAMIAAAAHRPGKENGDG